MARLARHYLRSCLRPQPPPQIGPAPAFEPQGLEVFQELLGRCRAYGEYGAGGSTVLAAQAGKLLFSVDSDPEYLDAVAERIASVAPTAPRAGTLLRANIGPTEAWGYPVVRDLPSLMRRRFAAYADAPWRDKTAVKPDLVLVDGRFRVACALRTCIALADATDWLLLFDDYTNRPYYHEIERHLGCRSLHGRMACFAPPLLSSVEDLQRAAEHYEVDFR